MIFVEQLAEMVLSGDRRSVARAITMIENNNSKRFELLAGLRNNGSKAHIIGLTGSPGAGKSSLVDQLTKEFREKGLTVGIIAVDPSSPFTGGAILGDRIRMQQHATDSGVFIRSMAARGSLGGLAHATYETIQVLAASGKDRIIVETVGVGQSELDIMKVADTTVVVLTPNAGDSIQTIKAGIMEIADVFAINKSDLPGAKRMASEVMAMLELNCSGVPWRPPVIETVTINPTGIDELAETIEKHRQFLMHSGKLNELRQQRSVEQAVETAILIFREKLNKLAEEDSVVKDILIQTREGKTDSYDAAAKITKYILGGKDSENS